MRERNFVMLVIIIFIALFAGWILQPDNPGLRIGPLNKEIKIHEGLDLQGGLQVLLQADVADCASVSDDSMEAAKTIVESRINGLGVTEPLIQRSGTCRLIVQLPGISNPDDAIRTFGGTGLLEFIDAGSTPLTQGQVVQTTGLSTVVVPGQATPVPTPTVATSGSVTTTSPVTATESVTPTFRTVMTGAQLRSASVAFQQTTNQPFIQFTLSDDGAKIFGDYTAKNVNKYLAITMDKMVISSPVIKSPITGGSGIIEGQFTLQEAHNLVLQLKYGSLPVPLKVVQSSSVGPTLGRDSVNRSITAGIIGLVIVVLFMLLYYRLPGLLADLALTVYAMIVLAIYKFGIPGVFDFVTLTLPGIAGFILSVGMAVDANILIFERMKEELRAGRTLQMAIEAGFQRAWSSIRDSNMSTLITCGILLWYGASFGASIVAGFALTLAIGVLVSLFTAVTVTRTFLRLTLDFNVTENLWWFGISQPSNE
ncbi:MAG: protein translocase subunit SecD [Chloroflexi bacterium]|nr:protein translocase subunit SecD [Chloroflexota bacterium]